MASRRGRDQKLSSPRAPTRTSDEPCLSRRTARTAFFATFRIVVVDPKDLASAMDDARKADDPALGEPEAGRAEEQPHPAMGERHSRRAPEPGQRAVGEITKAGGKVKPDKIVERDHLQTLLGKSRSALSQDPLSWGAEHLGINLKPLNLNDPAASATAFRRRH
jgi:hypothetical protein